MRNILTLLAGNCLGTVVGAVFFLSASRNFSLSQMGLYGVAISVQWILAGIAGTGLDVATVRLTTAHLSAGNRVAEFARSSRVWPGRQCYWRPGIPASSVRFGHPRFEGAAAGTLRLCLVAGR